MNSSYSLHDLLDNSKDLNSCDILQSDLYRNFHDRNWSDELMKLKIPLATHELMRLATLKQTNLLDSDLSEEEYDRYTSMGARIFDVPICLISLVDVNRQWFKSKLGLSAKETHRDLAFCSYTVLEDSPDVFVVPDAALDGRFKDNPLVTGPPYIRFYAGAAIIVDEQKIGSYCIIDNKPHLDFNLQQKRNLMDLGACVSQLIEERRMDYLAVEKDKATMVVAAAQSMRVPIGLLMKSATALRDCVSSSMKSDWLTADQKIFKVLQDDFHASVQGVTNIIELILSILMSVTKRDQNNTDIVDTCENSILQEKVSKDFVGFVDQLIRRLQACMPTALLTATFQDEVLSQNMIETYYDSVSLLVCSALGHNSGGYHNIELEFGFILDGSSTSSRNKNGVLSVSLNYSSPVDATSTTSNFSSIESSPLRNLESYVIHQILYSIKGRSGTNTKCHQKCFVPCFLGPRKDSINNLASNLYHSILANLTKTKSLGVKKVQPSDLPLIRSSTNLPSIEARSPSPTNSRVKVIKDNLTSGCPAVTESKAKILSVLVIEDTVMIRKMLLRILNSYNCTVDLAENGLVGLNFLQTNQYNLVLTDFLMPVMLGVEALKAFEEWKKESPGNSINNDTLIIGMSATADPSEYEEAFQYGMHFFCPKPVQCGLLDVLVTKLREASSLNAAVSGLRKDCGIVKELNGLKYL